MTSAMVLVFVLAALGSAQGAELSEGITGIEWTVDPSWERKPTMCQWQVNVSYHVVDFRNDLNTLIYWSLKQIPGGDEVTTCCTDGETFQTHSETDPMRGSDLSDYFRHCYNASQEWTFCACGENTERRKTQLGQRSSSTTPEFTAGTTNVTSCSISVATKGSGDDSNTTFEVNIEVAAADATTKAPPLTTGDLRALILTSETVSGTQCDKLQMEAPSHPTWESFVKKEDVAQNYAGALSGKVRYNSVESTGLNWVEEEKVCKEAWAAANGGTAIVEFHYSTYSSMPPQIGTTCSVSWTYDQSSSPSPATPSPATPSPGSPSPGTPSPLPQADGSCGLAFGALTALAISRVFF